MNAIGWMRAGMLWGLAIACGMTSACKLVGMPFRVAGSVADSAYRGGKRMADGTSEALERRKQRRELEEAQQREAAKKEQKASPEIQPGPAKVGAETAPDGPAIPLDAPAPTPTEVLPLPQ